MIFSHIAGLFSVAAGLQRIFLVVVLKAKPDFM